MNDPSLVWQSIQKEHAVMSLEEIRVRAQDAHWKVRRNLVMAFGLGAVVVILSTLAIIHVPYLSARMTAGGLMLLTVIAVYGAYRNMWRPDASSGCVTFYRAELEAQHRSLQITWRLIAATAVLSFFAGVSARMVIAAVLVAIMIERRYQAFQIKKKLAVLADFEEEP